MGKKVWLCLFRW